MYISKPDSSESALLFGIPASASSGSDVEESTYRTRKNAAWRWAAHLHAVAGPTWASGLLVWAVVATASNIGLLFILIGSGSPLVSTSPEPVLIALGKSAVQDLLPGRLSVEECVTPAYPMGGPDSDWYTLKAVPPPDPCLVRGMVIERLEPEYNFRRPYALGIEDDMDDKSYLLPYLRAFQDRTMATRKRRVLIDLGGNKFNSSTLWFLRNYPLSFTEIHVFEVEKGLFEIPASEVIPSDLLEHLNNHSTVPAAGFLPVPERVLNSIAVHEALVGTEDRQAEGDRPASVNITKFIVEELQLSEDDAVVVKMDIEWAEWDVLREMDQG